MGIQKQRWDVWTYASANSVTTPGNLTGTYNVGRRVMLKQGTIKYFVIESVTYGSPNTTIVLYGFGTYTLTNDPITSHIDVSDFMPQGFPATLPTWMPTAASARLSMRPFIEIGAIAAKAKPTIVYRGASAGYSLPIWDAGTNADEQLFISEYIAGRWNGASDISLSVIGYLASAEDVGDDFALQVSWVNKSTGSGVVPSTTTDVTVETNVATDRAAQYSIYKVDFAIDWDVNNPDILASDYFAARIRRVAITAGTGKAEITGEFVVTMVIITYTVDKVFKV